MRRQALRARRSLGAAVVASLNAILAPLVGGLPPLPFPSLFTLPALPSLDAIKNKH
jgi:hypothetical protein